MNEKFKVSREMAELISSEVSEYGGSENFLKIHAKVDTPWKGYKKPLNKITIWEMANILINGYEIKETPEEKLVKYYTTFINENDDFSGDVILDTLSILNIKIKGINE